MEETRVISRAKQYFDDLARGLDPVSRQPAPRAS